MVVPYVPCEPEVKNGVLVCESRFNDVIHAPTVNEIEAHVLFGFHPNVAVASSINLRFTQKVFFEQSALLDRYEG
jgi:hypothetical protein